MAEAGFARFVSLACHDLRTPLATVSGFAYTLQQTEELGEPASRYVEMIEAAAGQIADLLDDLGLVARIESGRYEPSLVEADSLELVQEAAELVGEQAGAGGAGASVLVDRDAVRRALAGLARCAQRHGALERVELVAERAIVAIGPVTKEAAPIVLAEDLRDLGAGAARRVVEALGGSLSVEGDRLLVRLPT